MELVVTLNGTDVNPYQIYGMSQNPFPQIGQYEYRDACLIVQKLAGPPIPDTDYIRHVLRGFSDEFVNLCCQRFEKGKVVTFTVTFPTTKGVKHENLT